MSKRNELANEIANERFLFEERSKDVSDNNDKALIDYGRTCARQGFDAAIEEVLALVETYAANSGKARLVAKIKSLKEN